MFDSLWRFLKGVVLLEAGASILFFGLLVHDAQLERTGNVVLDQLRASGYVTPSESDPVRVYDGGAQDGFGPVHAGGWRPGTITLRQNPLGSAGPEVYFRHELMHEASFRTCGGKLPLWAEEAAAINFSGEIQASQPVKQPSIAEINHLRDRIRIGAPLDPISYQTLKDLIALYGWPGQPCAVSGKIEELVTATVPRSETGFSYILINLPSGRVLEAKGDLHSKYPPGSLLKIPYAASLNGGQGEKLGEELAASDTARLASRKGSLDPEKLRMLLSPAGDSVLSEGVLGRRWPIENDRTVRICLGERAEDGSFPFQANLKDLALVLRASFLREPDRFPGLSRNGFAAGTTLYLEPSEYKQILEKLGAVSKTGTVSDTRGNPLAGHLMVAWPAESPVLLALFRTIGGNGASNLRRASKILDRWSAQFPAEYATVKVSVMTLTLRDTWEIVDECPSFERSDADGWKTRVSTCGRFRILSLARGSRTERCVSGIFRISPNNQKIVLETDSESYADAVLNSEAQDLRGESRRALRAVIVWNGVHGGTRHPESQSVCDSTHCMVFMGNRCEDSKRSGKTDVELLRMLDEIAGKKQLDWLPFSKGGGETWEVRVPSSELTRLTGEQVLLDMRRERTRNGIVSIHLFHATGEEILATGEKYLPCDVFRRYVKLPSCPESIRYDESSDEWVFKGIGEGHGFGLSVQGMGELERSGMTAARIIEKAYLYGPDGRN
jgi:hypothetical protein